MNINRCPEKYSDILRLLHELLLEDQEGKELLSIGEISHKIKKEGVNTDSMVSNVKGMIAKKRADLRLEAAKEKRMAYEKNAKLKDESSSIENVKNRLVQIINDLNSKEPKLAAMYFRKLEEVDEEDMKSILEDLLILKDEDEDEESRS